MKKIIAGFMLIFKRILKKSSLLAQMYRNLRVRKKLSAEVTFKKALGFKFNGPDDMESGQFEPDETYIFESLIEKFDLFVNIGANTGYYVLKALSRGIETLAFEPNELNVKLLLRNINANEFSAVCHVFPLALSDRVGILPIFGASTGASLVKGWAGQNHHELVPVTQFDILSKSIVQDKKSFILIDIEGAEFSCLKGAEKVLLNNDQTTFMIEICTTEHQPDDIKINPNLLATFELFFSYGFLGYTANREFHQVSIDEVHTIVNTQEDSFGTHNFLFTKDRDLLKSLK